MLTSTRPTGYEGREVTQPPDWHGLVELDVFLNAVTTGLFLVTAVALLVRPDLFAPLPRWAYPVALVVLLADLACLVLDLGDPARFHHMLRVFKPLSPMSLGTWCLTAYSLPLTLLAAVSVFGGPRWLEIVLIVVALPFAFGSAAYKGVLFSTTAQPGWRDARWLGAYHTSSALALGAAILLLLAILPGHDPATDVLRPAVAALAVISTVAFGLLARELHPAMLRAYSPGKRLLFEATVVLAGGLLPLGLSLTRGTAAPIAGSVLLIAASFVSRAVVVRLPHAAR